MIKLLALSVVASLALTGAAVAGSSFGAKLGENPAVSGGSFTSGGGITVAVDLREVNGRTAVCGVWAQSKRQSILTKRKARELLPAGSVLLGPERVVTNLLFLREVKPMKIYGGQEAKCVLSARPWVVGDDKRAATIRIPRRLVYRDVGEGGGGTMVYFFQTGPGAGG